jgi:hypothetical protein
MLTYRLYVDREYGTSFVNLPKSFHFKQNIPDFHTAPRKVYRNSKHQLHQL